MQFTVVLFTIVATTFALDAETVYQNIGPCNRKLSTDATMDFKKFSAENNGTWCEVFAPKAPVTENIKSLSYNIKPTSTKNQYKLTILFVKENGESGVFADEVVIDVGNGSAVSKGSVYTLKLFFLKYVPGRYAYYAICSDKGTDNKVDYRYVLVQDILSTAEENDIRALENSNKFKGSLMPLSLC